MGCMCGAGVTVRCSTSDTAAIELSSILGSLLQHLHVSAVSPAPPPGRSPPQPVTYPPVHSSGAQSTRMCAH